MEDLFLTIAKAAAFKAAEVHLSYFQKSYGVSFKDVHHNVVTDADIESEKSIVQTIRSEFPDHNFICEEGKYENTGSPYTWIIDPLDGTVNFSRNIPHFCVSLALAYEETLIVGVVYDPVRKEMFSAVKGGGAFLGDVPVQVTDIRDLKQAVLYTGFYYDRGIKMKNTLLKGNLDEFGKLLHEGWMTKKKFTREISNPNIDVLYDIGRKNGAMGGKILGAGGGGYLLLYCKFDKKHIIARELEKNGGKIIDFGFEPTGLQTWEVKE